MTSKVQHKAMAEKCQASHRLTHIFKTEGTNWANGCTYFAKFDSKRFTDTRALVDEALQYIASAHGASSIVKAMKDKDKTKGSRSCLYREYEKGLKKMGSEPIELIKAWFQDYVQQGPCP